MNPSREAGAPIDGLILRSMHSNRQSYSTPSLELGKAPIIFVCKCELSFACLSEALMFQTHITKAKELYRKSTHHTLFNIKNLFIVTIES